MITFPSESALSTAWSNGTKWMKPVQASTRRAFDQMDTVPMSWRLRRPWSPHGVRSVAREGNNLFGQWCYQAVRHCQNAGWRSGTRGGAFDDVNARSPPICGINSHRAYADLRAARTDLQAANQPVTGTPANHLMRYSSEDWITSKNSIHDSRQQTGGLDGV